MNRKLSLAALTAVVSASLLVGMLLGERAGSGKVAPAAADAAYSSGAQAATAPTIGQDFSDIVEKAIPAVVSVINTAVKKESDDEDDPHRMFRDDPRFRRFFGLPQRPRPQQERRVQSGGSGFLVSADGLILTNVHVVEDSAKLEVRLNDGTRCAAKVIGTDPNIDLALIQIDPAGRQLPSLPLGDSDRLRVGQWVIAIGNPLQFPETVTVGVVSAKGRRLPIGDTDQDIVGFIQTDAAINFGNSGGPLLDVAGRVVGINTAINRGDLAEGIGFALPINQARSAMEQLRATGKVRRGYIGIQMTDLNDEAKEYLRLPDRNGVLVQDVVAGGPAAAAGVQREDVIRKADGEAVKDGRDLLARIASRKPGDRIRLDLLRGGKAVTTELTLATRPDAGTLRGEAQSGEAPEQPAESSSAEGLGIKVAPLGAQDRQELKLPSAVQGVLVTDVETGSEADDAGVQPGVVITAVNDHPVRSLADWRSAVTGQKPGAVVKIDLAIQGGTPTSLFMRVPKEPKP